MLEQYVKDLLYEKDCVVIPDFGAIVANYEPATIKQAKQSIAPPSKKLAFNKSLKTNDGLLANYLADQEQITFSKALKKVREEANQWKRKLGNGETIDLPGIGSLYSDNEGNTLFKPDKATNFYPNSFGLSDTKLVPVKRAATHYKTASKDLSTEKDFKRPSPVLIGLASIGVTAVLLFFLLNLNLFEPSQVSKQIASFKEYIASNSESSSTKGSDDRSSARKEASPASANTKPDDGAMEKNAKKRDEVSGNSERSSASSDETAAKNDEDKKSEKTRDKPVEKKAHQSSETVSKQSRTYHLIAGSFKDKSNAKQLAKEAKRRGFRVKLIEGPEDFKRVSIGNYKSGSKAREFLNRIHQKGIFKVWLLEKNNQQNS